MNNTSDDRHRLSDNTLAEECKEYLKYKENNPEPERTLPGTRGQGERVKEQDFCPEFYYPCHLP